jgi:VWFA-related protein
MRGMTRRSIECVAALAMICAGGAVPAAQQTPTFSSSVEVTSIDATVLDARGQPATDLQPGDFSVRVDGSPRRVMSVQWVPLASSPGAASSDVPSGYTGNQTATGGRLIVLAIDEPHIPFGDNAPLLKTLDSFIDRLEPSDRISAVAFGPGGAVTPFTSDHEQVKHALERMPGQDRGFGDTSAHDLSLAESMQIVNGNIVAIDEVVSRECAGLTGVQLALCQNGVASDASGIVQMARQSSAQTIIALRSLLDGLAKVDAPKTVILVSQTLPMVDQELDVVEIGAQAATARASIYVIQLDQQTEMSMSKRMSTPRVEDRLLTSAGLDLLASASRGTLMRVAGDGHVQFDRIASELSGYYLLGLESDASDRNGKPHTVAVSVGRRGLTVRSRRELPVPASASARTRAPKDAVIAALTSPFIVSSLPLRAASFSVREPESDRVQVILHADIGTDYSSTQPVSFGYTIVDSKTGRQVDSEAADARLSPVMRGVPSALQFVTTASLDPGDYTFTLAVADGDRVGTVEHRFHAGLTAMGPVSMSDVMLGGPPTAAGRLRPTVGYTIAFGVVQAYIETYGSAADAPDVTFEIASEADGPALLEGRPRGVEGGRERLIFNEMFLVRQLPPGRYILRAIVSSHGSALKTLMRPFELETPAVLMTSAAVPGAGTATADIFLPVPDDLLARKFQRDEASRGETLRTFRATVAEPSRSAFDEGVKSLSSGDYVKAEQSFKSAIRPDADVTAPMAYLAAVYALTNNDPQAAGAWRTTMIDGGRFPEIYEWLGDTLLRTHDLSEAKIVLVEAAAKWPADIRFTKPLALVYATFGQGREAVRTLERWITAHPDDSAALSLGVEWMFRLHSAGAFAHSSAEDLKIARAWADAYTKAKGPQVALVKEWLQALEKPRN